MQPASYWGKQNPSRHAQAHTVYPLSLSLRELLGNLMKGDFDLRLQASAGRAVERASDWDQGQGTVSEWFRACRPELSRAWGQWEAVRPKMGQSQAVKGWARGQYATGDGEPGRDGSWESGIVNCYEKKKMRPATTQRMDSEGRALLHIQQPVHEKKFNSFSPGRSFKGLKIEAKPFCVFSCKLIITMEKEL